MSGCIPHREDRPEVGVGGDDHTLLSIRVLETRDIVSGREPEVAVPQPSAVTATSGDGSEEYFSTVNRPPFSPAAFHRELHEHDPAFARAAARG